MERDMNTEDTSGQWLGDIVQTFEIEGLDVRGRLVRLDATTARAVDGHGYPPVVGRLVCETMVLAAVLGSALKYDGVFTLQIQGTGGPVSLVMADMTSAGDMRAYCNIKEGAEVPEDGDVNVTQLLGTGHMAFTIDQGPDTDRYQGITELGGTTLAECAETYFRQSEQLDTAIVIYSDHGADGRAPRGAALMVQRLPSAASDDDEPWRRASVLMQSITAEELLDPALSPDDLLFRLYHEDGVRLFDRRPVRHGCRCSEERVQRTLTSFPKEEVASMAEDGRITVTCEFCRTDYVYSLEDLDALFAGIGEPAAQE